MKKNVILLLVLIITIAAKAQNSIPNGNFESWTSATFDYPQYYTFNSNIDNFYRLQLPFNLTKSTDAFHGSFAVQITTNATATDTSMGYFTNINPDNGNPYTWHGGMAYSQKPTGIRGYYKYNIASADSAMIIATFSKSGSNIGTYMCKIGGVHTSYQLFDFTFNPALTVTPDSVALGAISSDLIAGYATVGSTLIIDSVTFKGVTSQPTNMNGDFELWQSQTLDKLLDWKVQAKPGSFFKTPDEFAGNYAIELLTFLDNKNNHPIAQAASITTGYWDEGCMCMKGGHPFSNQVDTLVFHYKYTPALASDSAVVSLSFNKNGNFINGLTKFLPAATNYQYMEIPFNIGQVPDTAIVLVQSSLWNDTLVSYVGANFKIDEIHFKSQPLNTGIFEYKNNDNISIFPNPTTASFQILGLGSNIHNLEIYNSLGERVSTKLKLLQTAANEIDLSGFPKGIYLIKIFSGDRIFIEKIVKQ